MNEPFNRGEVTLLGIDTCVYFTQSASNADDIQVRLAYTPPDASPIGLLLQPEQALALLTWLEQERDMLIRLVQRASKGKDMVTLTDSQAKYIADRLRECYDALKESPKVDRVEIEFAIHLILDNPGYQEPGRKIHDRQETDV